MKTVQVKLLLAIMIIFWSAAPVRSQLTTDSLVKYVEIADRNNPQVLQKLHEYQAAMQKISQAVSLPDPELSAGFYLKPMELVSGNQVADLKLMQMFPWIGVLKFAKDEMSQMANARLALLNDTRLEVSYNVQRTWYELARIRNSITIAQKNIDILRDIEKMALVKYQFAAVPSAERQGTNSTSTAIPPSNSANRASIGMPTMGGGQSSQQSINSMQSTGNMQTSSMGSSAGSSGLADVYRIQIETEELQNAVAGMKSLLKSVIVRFNSYLNRLSDTPVFTPDTFLTDTTTVYLFPVNDSLLINNPMLQMLKYERQSIEARKRMVTRMGYPMVGLGLNYSVIGKSGMSVSSMNGKDMLMPMVSVTLPVYRKKYKAMAEEAEWLIISSTDNYTATENYIRTEFYQAIQQYDDAFRSVRLYNDQSRLALKSFEIMLRSFAVSTSTLTDLLRIRQQVYDYQLKQIDAKADLYTAKALIKRLTGDTTIK